MKVSKQNLSSINPEISKAMGGDVPPQSNVALPQPAQNPFQAQPLLGQADPLRAYIQQGGRETFEDFQKKYESAMSPEQFGFGTMDTFGIDPVASDAIKRAQSRRLQQTLGDIKGSMMRNAFIDYANRMGGYQQLIDARRRKELADQQRIEAQRAAERARKSSTMSGLGSILGGVAGFALGGPVGAMIGSGAGGMLGGSQS